MVETTTPALHSLLSGRISAVLNQASGSWTPTAEAEMKRILDAAGLGEARVSGAAPEDIDRALTEAAEDAQVLIVLGGDGTIRAAAEQASRTGALLAPLPGGTMNMLPKALYGERNWQAALADTLANPAAHPVSGGRVGDHAFFVAALFGGPTLWTEAREAARGGHLIDAARKSVTAARRSFSEPLEYEFGDAVHGSAEAVAMVCPMISKVMDDSERALEAAAIDAATAGDVLRLGFHALFDDWRNDPMVRRAKIRHAVVRGHGTLPIILDGERISIERVAEVSFTPVAFKALAPAD